jgi:predicted glycoside hydrolase/deacetylase ChbG (UPF0249 family)
MIPGRSAQLVVTADDLGVDAPRNRGIIEAIEAGVVTGVSLIANGPALDDGLTRLAAVHRPVSVGLHLNLSEGRPIVRGLTRLVTPDGRFHGKLEARRLLGQVDDPILAREVAVEIEAQTDRLEGAGLELDHLNGHQHVHLFPAVTALAADLASRRGISWFRIPDLPLDELAAATTDLPEYLLVEARLFASLARGARPPVVAAGLSVADRFHGLLLKGRMRIDRLVALIPRIPEGVTELMTHPGYARERQGENRRDPDDPSPGFSAFSTADRELELFALLDPVFVRELTARHVSLGPFPKV